MYKSAAKITVNATERNEKVQRILLKELTIKLEKSEKAKAKKAKKKKENDENGKM